MPGQTGQKQRTGSDVPVLAVDRVRFYGEPIALVAAETLDIAERALALIEIEYEPLPGVFDPLEALKPGAPIVHAARQRRGALEDPQGRRGGGLRRGRPDRREHLPGAATRSTPTWSRKRAWRGSTSAA